MLKQDQSLDEILPIISEISKVGSFYGTAIVLYNITVLGTDRWELNFLQFWHRRSSSHTFHISYLLNHWIFFHHVKQTHRATHANLNWLKQEKQATLLGHSPMPHVDESQTFTSSISLLWSWRRFSPSGRMQNCFLCHPNIEESYLIYAS